ncbi:MAG: GatB/YqeY domain-containing protein [Spirochaetia bacterium]|nr:GatB/YqeY domain-containing protein [Spirochaetota bacterium]MCX8096544.1 GatB/YqeY domain-containing protein [Spirochaetota bacterium]MDW8112702.1 GatB/YqeY domain-containing protein [Spirochaetia bacterium]
MILDKINEDYKNAVKERDEAKRETLNMLKSAIKYREIELRSNNKELNEEEIISVIQKEIKKRKEAIELYEKGGREDLAGKERREVEILESYLPKQLTEDEIREMCKEVIEMVGASSPSDIGKVMKEIMPKVKGRTDGSVVKRIVEEMLSK